MTQRNGSQQAKKAAFLAAYAELGTVTHAAVAAGMDRATHSRWMLSDPAYRVGFAEAETQAIDKLEREAVRRAVEGIDKPVYQGGKKVGTIREYSDTLLIFLMKGAIPSKYRDRVEVTVDVKSIAAKLAAERGLDEDEVMAEAERILSA